MRVMNFDDALNYANRIRHDKIIGLATGVFDVLHLNHARFLAECRSEVDYLFVGVNSDDSVRSLRGNGRPIFPALDRAQMLAHLSSVYAAFVFYEMHPGEVILQLKPHVFFKGVDYKGRDQERLPEWPAMVEVGTKMRCIGPAKDRSSTAIIEKIREAD